MAIEMVQHALNFAARGWRVLPCGCKGKVALLPQWPERATSDPAEVKALWRRYPEANIGIATGIGSGIFVLDVDGQTGTDSLLEWDSKGLQIPDTLRTKTGKGFHFYFALPNHMSIRNSASKLAPGLDVRGEGGYVIAPPSVHESGHRYEFVDEDTPIITAPEWLVQMLVQPTSTPAHPNATTKSLTEIIPEGQRNARLMSLAGSMQRRGMGPSSNRSRPAGRKHSTLPTSAGRARSAQDSAKLIPLPTTRGVTRQVCFEA